MMAEWLEVGMLVCFGASWPAAIWRTWHAKHVEGKSPWFSLLVLVGYGCGIGAHLLRGGGWIIGVYVADMVLVSTDLAIYMWKRHCQGEEGKTG